MSERKYAISVGDSRLAKDWYSMELTLSEFITSFFSTGAVKRTKETMAEYQQMNPEDKIKAKDVGGYVAGVLKDNKRKSENVLTRSMITLDLDSIPCDTATALDKIERDCPYAFIVHPSHSHTDDRPRLRIIIPLLEDIPAEQYEPVARMLASDIGIDWFDVTTYQPSRFMFWPSCPRDMNYAYAYYDGAVFTPVQKPLCDASKVLSRYDNWRDCTTWPRAQGEREKIAVGLVKQADPTEKDNIVGEFCRTYTVPEAIDAFLSDVYSPTENAERYTYTLGSTVGGLVIYEQGLFCYDNHSTSPTANLTCNAFDLVRIHKFGHLDESNPLNGATVADLEDKPSYTAMVEFALKDKDVIETRQREGDEKLEDVFTFEEMPEGYKPDKASKLDHWLERLETTKKGQYISSIYNVVQILTNDEKLKGRLYHDDFADRDIVIDPLPWTNNIDYDHEPRDWSDKDTDGLRLYLEQKYKGIDVKDKIDAGLNNAFGYKRIHPVREYLRNLPEWDGVERVETLLIDYLGVEDSEYVRCITKTHLVAAITRIFRPGAKYDNMITIYGAQGLGKSTFCRLLCGNPWFDDSLRDFKGKEPYEILQGHWMIEIQELAAYKKSDKEEFKAFMSKTADTYRPAYGRHTIQKKRQCVFWGTTNDRQFLRDETGDRRTWPVAGDKERVTKDVWSDLEKERDQIWAEAMVLYELDWPIVLSAEMAEEAERARADFQEEMPERDRIIEYLCKPIPTDWDEYDLIERRNWLDSDTDRESEDTELREYITATEIWVECFGNPLNEQNKRDTAKINLIMANLPGWKRVEKKHRLSKRVYDQAQKKFVYKRNF